MSRQVFINLPIKDMARSQAFFKSLGFEFNPQLTNEQGACMVISKDHSYAMLLVEPFFQGFTKKTIADATKTTEVLIALKWGLSSVVLLLMSLMIKLALWPIIHINRLAERISALEHIFLGHGA